MAWTGRVAELGARLGLLLRPGLRSAAEAAGVTADVDLGATFTDPAIEPGWNAAAARIRELGLTDEAGMNPGDRRALYYLMRHLRPARVLEIGTQAGASTVHLAAGLADAHAGSGESRLLTVDIKEVNDSDRAAWKAFRLRQSPRDAMRRLGYDHLVQFQVGRSLEVLREPGES
jgi:predicted O-methyltransferase YrrM